MPEERATRTGVITAWLIGIGVAIVVVIALTWATSRPANKLTVPPAPNTIASQNASKAIPQTGAIRQPP